MFEFEHADRKKIKNVTHPRLSQQDGVCYGKDRIRTYSISSWGEHCTECAFPDCYKTCSFYEPRPDTRCRRFSFGICRISQLKTWMPFSAFVEFRTWSQFWTQGCATQFPRILCLIYFSVGKIVWMIAAPIDGLLLKLLGRKMLSLYIQSVRKRIIKICGRLYRWFPAPEALLIEIFNPDSKGMTTNLKIKSGDRSARYEWVGDVQSGLNSFAIPVAEIEKNIDLSSSFDLALSLLGEGDRRLYVCSASFVRFRHKKSGAAVPKKKIKCVVWDLDNTLWDGVLVEGADSVRSLRDGIYSILNELDRRGILLSIASKNAEEDARKKLIEMGVWDLFLVPQINWGPKSDSIRNIATRLNIGIDSIAFVDDQAFERDEVAAKLPTVMVVPVEQSLSILGFSEFQGDISADSGSRRVLYKTEIARESDRQALGGNPDDFLRACNIEISIQRPGEDVIARIHDIAQRTNQLNISTNRYTLDEIRCLIASKEADSYIISCRDRYGDYGYVGFVVVDVFKDKIVIRDSMFSCRVQGKRIDETSLAVIINAYLANDAEKGVYARYVPTKRNMPAGKMLEALGFKEADADAVLRRESFPAITPDFIKVTMSPGVVWS